MLKAGDTFWEKNDRTSALQPRRWKRKISEQASQELGENLVRKC